MNKIFQLGLNGYYYLKYLRIKNNTSNVLDFFNAVKANFKNVENEKIMNILQYYPLETVSNDDREILLTKYPMALKLMPTEFKNNKQEILKLLTLSSSMAFLKYVPVNIINDKDFLVAYILKVEQANDYKILGKYINEDIYKDIDFISYLIGLKSSVYCILKNNENLDYMENVVNKILNDSHSVYTHKGLINLLAERVLGDKKSVFSVDEIKRVYDIISKITVAVQINNVFFLENYEFFIKENKHIIKSFENELVSEILKEYELKVVDRINNGRPILHEKVLDSGESNENELTDYFISKVLEKEKKAFILFNNKKIVTKENIEICNNEINPELKQIMKKSLLLVMLRDISLLKKYFKDFTNDDFHRVITDITEWEYRYAKNKETSIISLLKYIKQEDLREGESIDDFAKTMLNYMEKLGVLNKLMGNFAKSDIQEWKDVIQHLDIEAGGNAHEFKKAIVSSTVVKEVVLAVFESLKDKKEYAKSLKEIDEAVKNKTDILDNPIYKEVMGVNILTQSREEKIKLYLSLDKNFIEIKNLLVSDQALFKSLTPKNENDYKLVLKLFSFFSDKDLIILNSEFYQNVKFVKEVITNDGRMQWLLKSSINSKLNKSLFYDQEILNILVKKGNYISRIVDFYKKNIDFIKDFKLWEDLIKEQGLRIYVVPEYIDFFKFIKDEDVLNLLTSSSQQNQYNIITFLNNWNFLTYDFIDKYMPFFKEKNMMGTVISIMKIKQDDDVNTHKAEKVKVEVFKEALEKMRVSYDNDIFSIFKLFPNSLINQDDKILELLDLMGNQSIPVTYQNEVTVFFQKLFKNESFKQSYLKAYGDVTLIETIKEDNLFINTILTEWERLEMKKHVNKAVQYKAVKKY